MTNNGTYVLQTYGPEWRIAQVSAVENLFEEQDIETLKWQPNIKSVVESFNDSTVFSNFEDAWDAATVLESTRETELGVSLIRDFDSIKYSDLQTQYIKQHKG